MAREFLQASVSAGAFNSFRDEQAHWHGLEAVENPAILLAANGQSETLLPRRYSKAQSGAVSDHGIKLTAKLSVEGDLDGRRHSSHGNAVLRQIKPSPRLLLFFVSPNPGTTECL
jgi:hypothetical protein